MTNPITKFIGEVKAELVKVAWPSRNDSFKMAFYVILSTVIAALVIAGVDYIFARGVELIIGTK